MNATKVTATADKALVGNLPRFPPIQATNPSVDPSVPFTVILRHVTFGGSTPEAAVAAGNVQASAPTEFSPSKGVTIRLTSPEANVSAERGGGERPLPIKMMGAIKAA